VSTLDFPQEHEGDALETPELIQQRWAQRFLLREIPDFIVIGVCRSRRTLQRPHDADATRVERALRMEADELAPLLEATMNVLAIQADADGLRRFIDSNWPDTFGVVGTVARFMGHGQDHPLHATSERVRSRAENEPPEPDDEEMRGLLAISFLLLWADELAGDYQDPRVAAS
jgi:hypothetical protein